MTTLTTDGPSRSVAATAGSESSTFAMSRTFFGTLNTQDQHAQTVVLQRKTANPVWENGVIGSTNGRVSMTTTNVTLGENCIQRTARKHYRCVCADEVLRWRVIGYYDGGKSYSSRAFATEDEARNDPRYQVGAPASRLSVYERIEVGPVVNPDYRTDCLIEINPGDRYVEYVGEAMFYESGSRYCQRCGEAVWGQR